MPIDFLFLFSKPKWILKIAIWSYKFPIVLIDLDAWSFFQISTLFPSQQGLNIFSPLQNKCGKTKMLKRAEIQPGNGWGGKSSVCFVTLLLFAPTQTPRV